MTTTRNLTTSAATLFVGQCESCGLGAANSATTKITCSNCQATVNLSKVQGTFKGSVLCDSRCQFATGDHCECSCGGPNHGMGYAVSYTYQVPWDIVRRDTERHTAKLAKRVSKAAERAAKEAAEREVWLAQGDNRSAVEYLSAHTGSEFFASLQEQYEAKGALSERQVAAVLRSIERDKVQAERDAEAAKLVETGVKVPEGKVTVEGTIVSTRVDEGYYGTTVKCLVVTEEGWKVWGTKPKAASTGNGQHISFVATVTPSDTDPLFGFYSRPTKVVVS